MEKRRAGVWISGADMASKTSINIDYWLQMSDFMASVLCLKLKSMA